MHKCFGELVYHTTWNHFPADCNFKHLSVASFGANRLSEVLSMQDKFIFVPCCYRTFAVLVWACSFLSVQQACRSFFRVIYVGSPPKGPQLTMTADTVTPTRHCVIYLILVVNWNVFYKNEIWFCLIYSNNQWKMQKLIEVTTALGVNTELLTNLVL